MFWISQIWFPIYFATHIGILLLSRFDGETSFQLLTKLANLFSDDSLNSVWEFRPSPSHPLFHTHSHSSAFPLPFLSLSVLPSASSDEQKSPGASHWPSSTLRGELIGQLGPSGLSETGHWPREGSSDMSLVRLAGNLAKPQVFPPEKSLERKQRVLNIIWLQLSWKCVGHFAVFLNGVVCIGGKLHVLAVLV